MHSSVFTLGAFWALVAFSLVFPVAIYAVLWCKRAISPNTVLFMGGVLVLMAGVDVYLLQILSTMARLSPSLADDVVFTSELYTALYLLPAMFGGIGVNLVSHVLVRHLAAAERRFQHRRREAKSPVVGDATTGPGAR